MKRFVCVILLILVIIFTFYQTLFEGFYHSQYENYGDWKLETLPLIEPYAIYGSSDYYKNDWQTMRELVPMDFDSVDKIDNYDNVFGGLRNIDSIGIKDSLIIFHCKGNDYSSDEPEWLIFNTTKAIGICYKSEDNFRKNLKKLGYLNIKLYNPDSVYKEFAISHKMPPEWKEYEKKEHEKYWWIIKYWFH